VYAAHVLRSAAFGDSHDPDLVAGNDIVVDDRRSVVPRILSCKRIAGRLSQIAVLVGLTNALVEGFPDVPAHDVDILTDIDEKDGETRVLADRILTFGGNADVFLELLQHLLGDGRFIFLNPLVEGVHDVLPYMVVCIDQQFLDRWYDFADVDLSHDNPLSIWPVQSPS